MVINNFDIIRISIRPMEADSPPIIDANTVLTRTIAFECFKAIAGWHPQIIKPISDFKLSEFSSCDLFNVHKSPDIMTL